MDELRDFMREWIGIILVLAGLARALLLVAHDPLMGYANQADMQRTSACVGLFPAKEVPESTPEAPIATYRLGSRTVGCYQSTEVAIAATTLAIARALRADTSRFNLRWIGYTKVALLFGTALLIAWALRGHPGAAVAHGLVVALVLSDPVVTLWFNTLYTEFGAIWALYAAIGAACVLALSETPSYVAWGLLVLALVALAFSREQFALLGPAIVLASWPWLWHHSRRLTVATFAITLIASAVAFLALPRPEVIAQANRTDAYLGMVLPSSSEPTTALARLGLPETCAPMIGSTWYRQRGENIHQACPQVFKLSSFAFMKLAVDEPATLGRALMRMLPAVQSVSPPYVGTLEGARGTPLQELPGWAFSPLDWIALRMPSSVFVALTLATFLIAPAALIALLVLRRWRGDPLAPLLLAMLLGGTAIYSFATTVFGDGLSEAARHYLPGALAMYAALVAMLAGIPAFFIHGSKAPKEILLEASVGLVSLALAAFVGLQVVQWSQAQPAAIGVLDEPQGKQVPAGLKLKGWALDPAGVESVQVHVGSLQRPATYHEAGPAGGTLRVETIYPGYPDAERPGFILDLTPEDLAQAGAPNPLLLRIEVKNRNGVVTEVDRRYLQFTQ
jgi:hypothetical protein